MSRRLEEARGLRDAVLSETSGKIFPLGSFEQDHSIPFPTKVMARVVEINDGAVTKTVAPKQFDELVSMFPMWEKFVEQIHNKAVNNQDWAMAAERAKAARGGYIRFMKSASASDLKVLVDKLVKAQEAMHNRIPSAFNR